MISCFTETSNYLSRLFVDRIFSNFVTNTVTCIFSIEYEYCYSYLNLKDIFIETLNHLTRLTFLICCRSTFQISLLIITFNFFRPSLLSRDIERRALTPQPVRKPPATDLKQFLSPNLGGRARKLSKSSEDLIGKSDRWVGDLRVGLSASLQKDINMVSI